MTSTRTGTYGEALAAPISVAYGDQAVLAKTVANAALMQYEPGEPFYYVDEPMPIAQLIATIDALADCAEATR